MALKMLARAQVSSTCVLAGAAFTKANYNGTNTTIPAGAPIGVLGGSVAAIVGDYTAGAATLTAQPLGLFINDAAGAAWENAPAVASGKVGIVKGMASVEVDVFETQQAAASGVALVYVVGDLLYSSAAGLLTKEVSTSKAVIGVVTKVPTPSSPSLGVDMRI